MPYLTPDTPPDDNICLQVKIPNDVAWIGLFKGAVSELIKDFNFEQFGTYTPAETAQKFLAIYDEMVFSECDMGCCYDTVARRVTADGGIEISVNGGDWIPDPDDPRVTAPLYPPLTFDEHHTKCDAATNVAEHLNDIITETSDQLGGAGSLVEIASVIALAVFALFIAPETIPALAPLILPLISAILFLGQAAFDAYFTTDVHDKILCAVFCSITDEGTFAADDYANLIGQLTTDLPASPAKDYFIQIVSRIGLVGINDYAAIGTSADADCSDCGCGDECANIDDWVGVLPGTLGTIIDRGADFIEVQTEFYAGFGKWSAYINAGHPEDFNICCVCHEVFVNGVSSPYATEATPCGEDGYTTSIHNVTGSGTIEIPINGIGIQLNANSVVRFTFGA